MNNNTLYASAIIAVAIIIAVYLNGESKRYDIYSSSTSVCGFLLDKKTGNVWFMMRATRDEQEVFSLDDAKHSKNSKYNQ